MRWSWKEAPLRAAGFLATVILFCGSLYAQNPASRTIPRPSDKASCMVSGSVVRVGTDEPLKKAHIYLYIKDDNKPSPAYSGQTDASGHFVIRGIEPGRYELRVDRVGYVSQEYGQKSPDDRGAVLSLDAGRKMSDLLFRMVPWAVISGRITDEDGEALPDAEVVALRTQMEAGKRKLYVARYARANDLGDYRLFGLSGGRYYIQTRYERDSYSSARVATSDDTTATPQTGYAPVYYPGGTDLSQAVAINVAPGQEVSSIDIMLTPIRAVRIRGRAFSAIVGEPLKHCCVYLESRESNMIFNPLGRPSQIQGTEGAFEFDDVVPGSYVLIAMESEAGKTYFASLPIEVGKTNLDDVRLTIVPGSDLPGRVLVEGRELPDMSELHISLSGSELPSNPVSEVKKDGSFVLSNIPQGTYQVRVYGVPTDFFIKSAQVNGEDVLSKGLTASPGGSQGPLEIVLSSAGARVEGVVTNDDALPVPGATVALIPWGERRKQYRLYDDTTTDQYGKFILSGLAPGDYKIFAWKEVEREAWEDPVFLKPFESKGVEVKAEENGHIGVELKVMQVAPAKEKQ